jgi:hypothetical protein
MGAIAGSGTAMNPNHCSAVMLAGILNEETFTPISSQRREVRTR